jgi:hypothetical protein
MRFHLIIALIFCTNVFANEFTNCVKEESDSLWVEHHKCDQGKVQIGHEIFNDSMVFVGGNKYIQQYREKDNEVNLEFLKNIREIHTKNE